MAEAPQLSPHELDRVEDALEGLERLESFEDESPAVQRMLDDYQQILVASRIALPMVEVPTGALDAVFAEARNAEDVDVLGIQDTPPEPEQPSFWAKLRKGFMIPGLAVAGTAVVVLLLVKPTMRDSGVVAQREDAAAPQSVSENSKLESDPAAGALGKRLEAAPPVSDLEAAAGDAEPAAAATDELVEIATSRRSKTPMAPGAAEPAPPAATPVAPAEDKPAFESALEEEKAEADDAKADDEDERAANWADIEKGDKARKNGDCFAASNAYRRALDDGNDSVRARAHAGIGLCQIAEGDDVAATEHFDEAESLDPEVRSYISTQTPDAPKPSAKAKRKPSKKRKSAPAPKGRNSFGEVDSPFKD